MNKTQFLMPVISFFANKIRANQMAGAILLDRDGVLNSMVINVDHGTVDSPLHPSQVELISGVEIALRRLYDWGFKLIVITNQPAAAKGKTTRENLELVHQAVILKSEAAGAKILDSFICFHRAEDECNCRKPKTQLLQKALEKQSFDLSTSWMVGDGVTDVQAGRDFGVKTAFLGPKKCDHWKVLTDRGLRPDFWGNSLAEFVNFVDSTRSNH